MARHKTFPYDLKMGEDFGLCTLDALKAAFEKARPYPLVALPTGDTPSQMYLRMRQNGIMFDFNYLNIDQYRGIKFSDKRSYPREIKRKVMDPLGLNLRPEFIFDGEGNVLGEPKKIENAIKGELGIDVCVLGIGPNGHLAFNEPYSAFNSRSRVVKLTESTRQANAKHCDPYGGVPREAFTIGLGTIMDSKQIILLSNKPEITLKALHGRVTTKIPASVLQRHPNVTVVATPQVAQALRLAA